MAVTRSPSTAGGFLQSLDDLLLLLCAGAAKTGAGAGLWRGRLPYGHELVRIIAQRCWSIFDQALTKVMEGRNRPRCRVSPRDVDLLLLHVYIRSIKFGAEVEDMQGSRPVTVAQRMHVVLGYSVKSEKLSSAPALGV